MKKVFDEAGSKAIEFYRNQLESLTGLILELATVLETRQVPLESAMKAFAHLLAMGTAGYDVEQHSNRRQEILKDFSAIFLDTYGKTKPGFEKDAVKFQEATTQEESSPF